MKPLDFTRAASLAPTTYDAESRTVEVNFSTFADVQRFDGRGPYIERLDPKGLDLSRFIGASVLNAHAQRGLGDVLGVVLNATRKGIAKLQLSAREDVAPFVADIAAGIIRHLSIGYRVTEIRESIDPKSGARVKTATRWSPHEISFVPVPADFGATTRSQNMDPELENAPEQPAQVQTQTRAQINAAIRSLAKTANLDPAWVDSQIDAEATIETARAAAFTALEQRQTPVIRTQVGFSNEDPRVILDRRAEARFVRDNGGQLSDAARPYVHETLLDVAKDSLRRSGVSTLGMSPDEVFTRAATHGTSDFPEFTTAVGRRVMLNAYQAAPAPIKTIARSTTAADFRAKSSLRISGAGLLEEIGEHGEIKSTTRAETKESYALRTFARMFGISRKALVNDDLGAFNDSARIFGQAAAQTEAAELVQLLESNPQLEDNTAVFDASRNNFDAGGTPISIEAIGDARLAMRKLTDEDGTLISVGPKYLVVSAELETAAQQFVAAYQALHFSETNPFSTLTVLVEPRLAAFSWYLFADPASAPVLEYAHLAGASGPVIESRPAWTTLGMETRAYLDFGAGFVGWKGAYKFESGEDSNSAI
ncbi:MAG: prohead protease/major capsid protein fusion protein [Hyphomonadaceae bacterium]